MSVSFWLEGIAMPVTSVFGLIGNVSGCFTPRSMSYLKVTLSAFISFTAAATTSTSSKASPIYSSVWFVENSKIFCGLIQATSFYV